MFSVPQNVYSDMALLNRISGRVCIYHGLFVLQISNWNILLSHMSVCMAAEPAEDKDRLAPTGAEQYLLQTNQVQY